MLRYTLRIAIRSSNVLSLFLFLLTSCAAIASTRCHGVLIIGVGRSIIGIGIERYCIAGGFVERGGPTGLRGAELIPFDLHAWLGHAFEGFYAEFYAGDYVAEIPWAYCPLAFGFTTIVTSAMIVYQRRRLRPKGHCALCGYDLRETPNQCPECGATGSELTRRRDNIDRLGELSRKPLTRAMASCSCIGVGAVILSACLALFIDMVRSGQRHQRSLWTALHVGAGATVALSLLAAVANVAIFYGSKWRWRAGARQALVESECVLPRAA